MLNFMEEYSLGDLPQLTPSTKPSLAISCNSFSGSELRNSDLKSVTVNSLPPVVII